MKTLRIMRNNLLKQDISTRIHGEQHNWFMLGQFLGLINQYRQQISKKVTLQLSRLTNNMAIAPYTSIIESNPLDRENSPLSKAYIAKKSPSDSNPGESSEKNTNQGNTSQNLRIEEKLMNMDKEFYEPFVMYLEGYMPYEIANYLHVPEDNIKKRIETVRTLLGTTEIKN